MSNDDPHTVLGLDSRATAEDVRRAYFRLVRLYTPEAHPEQFKRVRAAYEALRSPLRRAELALMAFDETMSEVDLDLVASVGEEELDLVGVLLTVELSASELAEVDSQRDLTPLREQDLFGP
ncbi:MAG TPA: DnaJ domain-containing protein [Chloroflexota bacterium]|nr:DnaJ domain-containing protein [Chloroflexota bacterium]